MITTLQHATELIEKFKFNLDFVGFFSLSVDDQLQIVNYSQYIYGQKKIHLE